LFFVRKEHYAATWLLHPDAPEVKISTNLKRKIQKFRKVFGK
jgi:hypothetical protein